MLAIVMAIKKRYFNSISMGLKVGIDKANVFLTYWELLLNFRFYRFL